MITPEQKVVFGISDDKKTVILGMSRAAFEYCSKGMTHTFDLNVFGVPVRIVLFGGETRQEIKALFNTDKETLDVSGLDVGFGGEE